MCLSETQGVGMPVLEGMALTLMHEARAAWGHGAIETKLIVKCAVFHAEWQGGGHAHHRMPLGVKNRLCGTERIFGRNKLAMKEIGRKLPVGNGREAIHCLPGRGLRSGPMASRHHSAFHPDARRSLGK